jgi:hypothetical protein
MSITTINGQVMVKSHDVNRVCARIKQVIGAIIAKQCDSAIENGTQRIPEQMPHTPAQVTRVEKPSRSNCSAYFAQPAVSYVQKRIQAVSTRIIWIRPQKISLSAKVAASASRD